MHKYKEEFYTDTFLYGNAQPIVLEGNSCIKGETYVL